MNYSVVIDWKFVVALGVATVGTIFAVKIVPTDVKEVWIHAVDACKDYAIAINGEC